MPGQQHSSAASEQPRDGLVERYWRMLTAGPWLIRLIPLVGLTLVAIQRIMMLISVQGDPESLYRKDFLQEYVMVRAVAAGENPYLPVTQLAARYIGAQSQIPFAHPTPHSPIIGLLLLPLALVDYVTAATWWLGVSLGALLVGMIAVFYLMTGRWALGWPIVLGALSLTWAPVISDLAVGNLNIILMCLLAGCLVALRVGRSLVAGVLVGLSLLIKPIAWPLVAVLLWRRDYRAVVGTLAINVVGYLLVGWIIGIDRIVTYFGEVLPLVGRMYRVYHQNVSVWTLGSRLFHGTVMQDRDADILIPPLFVSEPLAWLVGLAMPAGLLLLTALMIRRHIQHERAIAVAICLSVVVSPVSWSHYHVLLLLPMAHIAAWLRSRQFPPVERRLALIGCALLLLGLVDWTKVALLIADLLPRTGSSQSMPTIVSVVTMWPTFATVYLGWLVLRLRPDLKQPPRDNEQLAPAA